MANGLTSLFQVAPWAGSYIAGDMLGQEANYQDAKQQELMDLIQQRAANSRMAQEKFPLELEQLRLGNQTTQAQLPGVEAQSMSSILKAQKEKATQAGDIDAANTKNYNSIFEGVAPQFGVIGKEIAGVPGVQQPAALFQSFKRRGLSDAHAQKFVEYFAQHGGGDISKKLSEIGDAFLRANPQYVREITQEGMRNQTSITTQRMQNESQANLERMRQEGQDRRHAEGEKGKNKLTNDIVMNADMEARGKPPSTQLAVYKKWYDHAIAIGNVAAATSLASKATSLAETVSNLPQGQPRAGTPDVGALTKDRVPVNPVPRVPIQPLPGADQGGALARPSAPQAAAPDLKSAVEKAGQKYEPDKFDYRIGPNGQVQRKPKGK